MVSQLVLKKNLESDSEDVSDYEKKNYRTDSKKAE